MPILLPTVNNERKQWEQCPQFRIPSHASFIPNHQFGQKSKIFLLRLPCNYCPHTSEVYVAQTGGTRGLLTRSGEKTAAFAFHSHMMRAGPLCHGACCFVQGHLASAPSWAVGVLHWVMTSLGQVPHIITPWPCCGSTRASRYHINQTPGIQPSYKPNLC